MNFIEDKILAPLKFYQNKNCAFAIANKKDLVKIK